MKQLTQEEVNETNAIFEDVLLGKVSPLHLKATLEIHGATVEGNPAMSDFVSEDSTCIQDKSYKLLSNNDEQHINDHENSINITFNEAGQNSTFLPVIKIASDFQDELLFILHNNVTFRNIVFDLSDLRISVKDFLLAKNGQVSFYNCHYLPPDNNPNKPLGIWLLALQSNREESDGVEQITAPSKSVANLSANNVPTDPKKRFLTIIKNRAAAKRHNTATRLPAILSTNSNITGTGSSADHKTTEIRQQIQSQTPRSHADSSDNTVNEKELKQRDPSGLMTYLSQTQTPPRKKTNSDRSWITAFPHERHKKPVHSLAPLTANTRTVRVLPEKHPEPISITPITNKEDTPEPMDHDT